MIIYHFIYRDGAGFQLTKTFKFESDEDALAAAAMTYERFGVEVVRERRTLGRFPPCMAIGLTPREDIVMT